MVIFPAQNYKKPLVCGIKPTKSGKLLMGFYSEFYVPFENFETQN